MARKRCEHCERPLAVCLCQHMVNVNSPFNVLILQHSSEQKQPLATVPIIQKCLDQTAVWVGETFERHEDLAPWLREKESVRVIFPSDSSTPWDLMQSPASTESKEIRGLIFIDGTWRKAKKIWHSNAWLNEFQAVSLINTPPSHYRIRQSQVKASLSTIEAVAYSIKYLTNNTEALNLLTPFNAMIDKQIELMGEDVFNRNYN